MKKLVLVIGLAVALMASSAFAISISVYDPVNSPITTFSYTVTGNTIDLYETWTGSGRGFLEIYGLDGSEVYTVNKHITNSTGYDWFFFTNELLDPAGQDEDALYDIFPYPGWVPSRWSTSNDNDGLSFAQGYGIPRTSSSFSTLFVDELTDSRDFLEFSAGMVSGMGGFELESFGLTNSAGTANEPFLLAQRPNERAIVPEPGTLMLLGSGLLGLGFFRRKK